MYLRTSFLLAPLSSVGIQKKQRLPSLPTLMALFPIGLVLVLVSPDLTHRRVRGESCLAHGSRFDAFACFSMI